MKKDTEQKELSFDFAEVEKRIDRFFQEDTPKPEDQKRAEEKDAD